SQFSEPLQFQVAAADRLRDVTAWIHSHLRSDLSVETLAARVFLSPRQFARAFRQEVGTTPAAFVEEARLADASRRLVESNRRVGLERIAASVGFQRGRVLSRVR